MRRGISRPTPPLEKLRKKLNIDGKLLKCQEAGRVHLGSFSFFSLKKEKKNTKSAGGWVRVGLGARRQWKMSG